MKKIKELSVLTVYGQVERLSDYKVQYSHSIDANKSISVQITKTKENSHSFDLVQNLNWLIYEGEQYNISNCVDKVKNGQDTKELQGTIKWLWDLHGKRVREVLNGHIKPEDMLKFILKDTGYKFNLIDDGFDTSAEVENFGNNGCKDLLSSFKDKFQCEISCVGDTIYAAKQLGKDTEKILKQNFNISDIVKSMDTSEFFTYIRGWGAEKEPEEDSDEDAPVEYVVEGEHISPYAQDYGIREAPWVDDRRFTQKESLQEAMIRQVNDSLDISLSLTAKQLEEMDISDVQCGDLLWCIVQPYDVNVKLRIVEVQSNQDPNTSPLFTIGTLKGKLSKRFKKYENTNTIINKVVDVGNGQIRSTAINTSNISVDLKKAKGTLPAERISGLPSYDLASSLANGLMSSEHFTKVELINIDPNGNISIPLADAFSSGLMSSSQFSKLEGIQVDSNGQVVVDVTAINSKIDALELRIRNLESGGTIG